MNMRVEFATCKIPNRIQTISQTFWTHHGTEDPHKAGFTDSWSRVQKAMSTDISIDLVTRRPGVSGLLVFARSRALAPWSGVETFDPSLRSC